MNLILALVNQKGGCGKTTSAIHLAAAFAKRDLRVLLVDLDPQGHASLGLGVEAPTDRPSLSDVLAHTPLTGIGPALEQTIVAARPGLDVVPANLGLAGLEMRLATVPGREERLAEHLAEVVEGWDIVVIDSPPNLGLLTVNALVAAGKALIPLEPSPFSVQGIERILDTIKLVEEHTGHTIGARVLPTMVPGRDGYALELIESFRAAHPSLVLPVHVRRSVLFPRAAAMGRTLGEMTPHAPGWKDYLDTAETLAQEWRADIAEGRPRFTGLRVVAGGVEFSHPECEPAEVLLAGGFNGWLPDGGVELRDRGVRGWSKFLRLPPGRYEYKFIVRNEWIPDPVNPRRADNGFGVVNSVIDVPPASGRTPAAPRPAPGPQAPGPHR